MGLRRLLSLVRGLPRGGALHRAVDPQGSSWGTTEELLAGLCELVDINNRLFFKAHSAKSTRQPPPLKVRRPEPPGPAPERHRPRQATAEELVAFLSSSSSGR